eukprot:COSAG02_NODE_681_length_18539_cov_44.668925_7_plen_340_part_00
MAAEFMGLPRGEIVKHPLCQGEEVHRVFIPTAAASAAQSESRDGLLPVIVYYHGAGGHALAGGPDWALSQGLPALLSSPDGRLEGDKALKASEEGHIFQQEKFPFIVLIPMVAPHIRDDLDGVEQYDSPTKTNTLNGYTVTGLATKDSGARYLGAAQQFPLMRPRVAQMVEHAIRHLNGDPKRVTAMGMSQGGRGALELCAARPDLFAGCVSACGMFGNNWQYENHVSPAMPDHAVQSLLSLPGGVWLFHSADDSCVPVENSRLIVRTLRAAKQLGASEGELQNQDEGNPVKYTEFETAPPGTSPYDLSGKLVPGHGSFEIAFRDPAVYSWILRCCVRP